MAGSAATSTRTGSARTPWRPITLRRRRYQPRSTSRSRSHPGDCTVGGVVGRLRPAGRPGTSRSAPGDRGRHRLRLPTPQPTRVRRAVHHHRPPVAVPPADHLARAAGVRDVRSTQIRQPRAPTAPPSHPATTRRHHRHQIRAPPDDRHPLKPARLNNSSRPSRQLSTMPAQGRRGFTVAVACTPCDLDLIRAGGTPRLFSSVYAPTTLGTLLQECRRPTVWGLAGVRPWWFSC